MSFSGTVLPLETAMEGIGKFEKPRVDWVDFAKGICIIWVVMKHSIVGVEVAGGHDSWMHVLATFAKPFRMPDFFLLSGLFLGRVLDRNWRDYLDKKVVHFFYFYVLWVSIQFSFKAPLFISQYGLAGTLHQYLLAYVEPFGTLWFIYLLPVMFVVVKLTRVVPALGIFIVASALEIANVNTGWIMVDEFCGRFVYFFAGYWLAKHFFDYAALVQENPRAFMAALLVWGGINGTLVFGGYAEAPFLSLALGFAGSMAVITIAALMAKVNWFNLLRYAGENSIVVYLAFFLPMAATRIVLLKTGIIPDLGTVALVVTAAGVIGPLVFHALIKGTRANFLFERPAAFHLSSPRKPTLQAAE
jgi:uncharacterized membrane protein YcfT